ncbi:MAG: TonB-dependent receptor family protein [Gemmatimonadota bacterium]
MPTSVGLAAAVLLSGPVAAQDSVRTVLEPIRVSVSRDLARSTLELPFGVARLAFDTVRTGARRASLTDLLIGVPGLVVSNRHNPTQDPRLSIRGFGARAAFGIRGVRVMRDGVPLTLADGQTAVDFVDLESVGSAEVMRGAAGALYGNASGGVLELRTEPVSSDLSGRARTWFNEDARRFSLNVGGLARDNRLSWQATGTANSADGPRDYSRFKARSAFGEVRNRIGEQGSLRLQVTAYDSPLAENPGAVTAPELANVPWVADSQNIRRKASKTVRHTMVSLQGERSWAGGLVSATVFGGTRELSNPQAFAIVEFDRTMAGLSGRAQHTGGWPGGRALSWTVSAGGDLTSMRDDRHNYTNCAANTAPACTGRGDIGPETLSQVERVMSGGVFTRAEIAGPTFNVSGSLRGDRTAFNVRDRRVTAVPGGSIQSLNMGAVTPMMGVAFRPRTNLSLYASLARSFETPTTTELANQPDGSTGINRDLSPQSGRTIEAGIKGLAGGWLSYDLSAFNIATLDELIPFEIPGSGGRRYFRNAGKTLRKGIEVAASARRGPIESGLSVATIDYEYEDFTVGTVVLDGRKVPGVPPTFSTFFLTGRGRLGFATVEVQQSARTAADDANVNHSPGWVVWNARAGHIGPSGSTGIEPVVGIDNIFGRHYAANIVTNATRGRFYEPGAGRRIWAGLSIRTAR